MSKEEPILEVSDASASYGRQTILQEISLALRCQSVVAIVGHNGAGKSTLLKVCGGLLKATTGLVRFKGAPIHGSVRDLRRRGLIYSPQGHRLFRRMTVGEQLKLAADAVGLRDLGGAIHRIREDVPELDHLLYRRAGLLSGGERQSVSLAMALLSKPEVLLIDEPSYGLAPPLVGSALSRIRTLADKGCAVAIVEQRVRPTLAIADVVLVLRRGRISFTGPPGALSSDDKLREVFL